MIKPLIKPLNYAVLIGLYSLSNQAIAAEKKDVVDLGTTTVYAQETKAENYTKLENDTASILTVDNQDTPQAIGTVTHGQIEDFNLYDISQVLDTANAVKVEQTEPGRWYLRSRGFEVNNVFVDGIAVPSIYNNYYGSPDAAVYDSVDIVRGANGMMNSFGMPSATVNLTRKMPTAKNQGKFKIYADQHKGYRGDADVSGSLNDSGSLKGRLVISHAGGETYLDRQEPTKNVAYGVISADLTDNITVSLGHEYNKQDEDSAMFGALPLYNNLGGKQNYDVSTSSAPSWANLQGGKSNTFAKLEADFGQWTGKLTADHNKATANTFVGFAGNVPSNFFPLLQAQNIPVENALTFTPYKYDYETTITTLDGKLSREFELGGRTHEFGIGAQWSESETDDVSFIASLDPAQTIVIPSISQINTIPEPSSVAVQVQDSHVDTKETAVYFSSRINPIENTNLYLGGRYVDFTATGDRTQNGVTTPEDRRLKKFSPSVGLTYNFPTTDTTIYTNYTSIFDPQTGRTESGNQLPAAEGSNIEVGFKQSFNNDKAFVSANIYRTKQDDLKFITPESNPVDGVFYGIEDVESQGFEVDITGNLTDRTSINGGLATVAISNRVTGERIRRGFPSQTLKLGMVHAPSALPKLRIGGSLNYENDTSINVPAVSESEVYTKDAVTLLNLFAEYDVTNNLGIKLNIDNVTDEKYFNNLRNVEFGNPQAYYGKPMTVSGSLIYKY